MQTNIHNKKQNHDPYARDHCTDIVLYNSQRHNQKIKHHKGGAMQFLASATIGAVTGNGIARYTNANRSFQLKNDALPIAAGTAVPPVFIEFTKWFIEASVLQPTKLRLLQTAIAGAGIAYLMTPSDPVAEDKKTDTPKADAPKPVPTDSNNQPQTTPITIDNQPQTIPTSPQATPQNNTPKSLSEQALDFFSNLLLPKQPKPKKEPKPVTLTAYQIRLQKELQEYEREEQEQAERQRQQAEALERELAYMQTDAYKEEQRLEAEAKKRAEAEADEARRQASKRFDKAAREYFDEQNRRREQRRQQQDPNYRPTAGQIPTKYTYDVQELLEKATTPQRRVELGKALDILRPYLKDKAHTLEEITQKIIPHHITTSEEDFNKIQSKNVKKLQLIYHPDRISNLSVPQDKQAKIEKQLDIISGFITNLKNITYHFKLRDQTE